MTPHARDYLLGLDARGPRASLFHLETLDSHRGGYGTRPERLQPIPKPPPGVSLSPRVPLGDGTGHDQSSPCNGSFCPLSTPGLAMGICSWGPLLSHTPALSWDATTLQQGSSTQVIFRAAEGWQRDNPRSSTLRPPSSSTDVPGCSTTPQGSPSPSSKGTPQSSPGHLPCQGAIASGHRLFPGPPITTVTPAPPSPP